MASDSDLSQQLLNSRKLSSLSSQSLELKRGKIRIYIYKQIEFMYILRKHIYL